jgi:hypothetical protein
MWNATIVAAVATLAFLPAGHIDGLAAQATVPADAGRVLALNAVRDKWRTWVEGVGLNSATVRDADVTITRVPSGAIPRLVYTWAFYLPPGSSDMWIETVAAQVGTSSRVLVSTDDWLAVARSVGWQPSTTTDAIEGCAEVVQVSSPERSQHYGAALMRKAGTATEPEQNRGSSVARQTFKWSEPQARRLATGEWDVEFWMAESAVHRYRCDISATALTLVRTETAPSWMMGYMRPGG